MKTPPAFSAADLDWLAKIVTADLTGLIDYTDLTMLNQDQPGEPAAVQAVITAKPVWDFEFKRAFLPLIELNQGEARVRAVVRLDGVDSLDRISRRGPYLTRICRLSLEKFIL